MKSSGAVKKKNDNSLWAELLQHHDHYKNMLKVSEETQDGSDFFNILFRIVPEDDPSGFLNNRDIIAKLYKIHIDVARIMHEIYNEKYKRTLGEKLLPPFDLLSILIPIYVNYLKKAYEKQAAGYAIEKIAIFISENEFKAYRPINKKNLAINLENFIVQIKKLYGPIMATLRDYESLPGTKDDRKNEFLRKAYQVKRSNPFLSYAGVIKTISDENFKAVSDSPYNTVKAYLQKMENIEREYDDIEKRINDQISEYLAASLVDNEIQ